MIRNRISLLYVQRDIRRPLVYPSSSQREGRRTSGSAHSGICLKKTLKNGIVFLQFRVTDVIYH